MSRLPEDWVLLQDNPVVVIDPSTGNRRPGEPIEVPCRGLLQQRQLASSSVDAGNVEFVDGHVVSSFVLLLDPGLVPHPVARDKFRGPDGTVFTVVGRPRVRQPVRGSRRPAYISAIVRSSSDYQE
jgi:hypothetical protein